jgi:hypothetical protein
MEHEPSLDLHGRSAGTETGVDVSTAEKYAPEIEICVLDRIQDSDFT